MSIRTEGRSSFFEKKEPKKLSLTAGCDSACAKSRGKQKFFASFFQKRSAFLALLVLASPAYAQQFPQDATPGKCLPTPQIAPGASPGGNIYASHFGPQPHDAPNSEIATYPDVTQIQPDPIPNDSVPQNDLSFKPFPYSGGINDPVLSPSGGPEISGTTNKGC